eukprot:373232-Rhodomonas_salina.1
MRSLFLFIAGLLVVSPDYDAFAMRRPVLTEIVPLPGDIRSRLGWRQQLAFPLASTPPRKFPSCSLACPPNIRSMRYAIPGDDVAHGVDRQPDVL